MWLITLAFSLPLIVQAAAPANDSFNNRIILTGTAVFQTATNTNASRQSGEPDHAGNIGGKSLWWSWTAPGNGDVTITTDGSDFDTLLGVYTGSPVSALSLVASNDDHGVFVSSRVRFQTLGNTQYQLAVDGYNDGTAVMSGNVALKLSFVPEPISRPANDNFTNRILLVGSRVNATNSNVNATREPLEPFHANRFGNTSVNGDTSIWWKWTAPANDTVRITTTGSSFDTLLGVYTGPDLSHLTEVGSSEDDDAADGILTSTVVLNVAEGLEYQIAVDGYDGDSGAAVLGIESVPRLTAPRWLPNGSLQFGVKGAAGSSYEVQGSIDLTNWTLLGLLTNSTGTAIFLDNNAASYSRRFYRALLK